MMTFFFLGLMLFLILLAAILFTNALEHFGEKVGISAGVVGSIFAAVATALPESSVPIIALLAGTAEKSVNQQISVGAILGAPLMISTLAIFLMTLSVVRMRGFGGRIKPEKHYFQRDLDFFLAAFFLAALAMYLPRQPDIWRELTGCALILLYISYLYLTVTSGKKYKKGDKVVIEEPLTFSRLGMKDNMPTIIFQLVVGVVLLVYSAHGLIHYVAIASDFLGVSPLILSLLIVPIATELPEKVNSIIWVRKNKDTLAVGNLTGALVFQGTLLPALGIILTPWTRDQSVSWVIFITLAAALWLRINSSDKGVRISAMMVNGFLYFLYLYFAILQQF